MENIQNILEPVVAPKKTNFYKFSFFIAILIIIGMSVYIFTINKKDKSIKNQSVIQIPTEVNEEVTPTIATVKTNNSEINVYSKLQNGTNNLILNRNGKETIIDSLTKNKDDQSLDDKLFRFEDIKFTSNFKYLTYEKIYATVGVLKIYNLQNNFFVEGFDSVQGSTITNDEKYLIQCQNGGYDGVVGQIISLTNLNVEFDLVKYLGNKLTENEINCSENNGKVVFSYNSNQKLVFDLTTLKIE